MLHQCKHNGGKGSWRDKYVLMYHIERVVPPKPVPVLLVKGPADGMDWAGDGAKPLLKAGVGGIAAGLAPNAPTICVRNCTIIKIHCYLNYTLVRQCPLLSIKSHCVMSKANKQ